MSAGSSAATSSTSVASATARTGEFLVRQVLMTDPLVAPMLAELHSEYTSRYGRVRELDRYPAEEFAPPHGAWLLFMAGDEAVAGGAFRRYDGETAELKRIWTHSAHRKRGLGRRVVAELEILAAVRGYRRIYLTTGPRQPEARGLYLAAGYQPLFDLAADPETIGPLPFEKLLPAHGVPAPAPSPEF
ncbi:MAG TPA: GNAT family N-acetyltransferase [Pseudonocardiaceae bacterium]|jgi:polar amino acid transport system permease protein|nr:GNAT family N-acetyltransferase [Pseudonocardiaceae bacterium]